MLAVHALTHPAALCPIFYFAEYVPELSLPRQPHLEKLCLYGGKARAAPIVVLDVVLVSARRCVEGAAISRLSASQIVGLVCCRCFYFVNRNDDRLHLSGRPSSAAVFLMNAACVNGSLRRLMTNLSMSLVNIPYNSSTLLRCRAKAATASCMRASFPVRGGVRSAHAVGSAASSATTVKPATRKRSTTLTP